MIEKNMTRACRLLWGTDCMIRHVTMSLF